MLRVVVAGRCRTRISKTRVFVRVRGLRAYSHASAAEPIDAASLTESLRAAARDLLESLDNETQAHVQRDVVNRFPTIIGTGDPDGRGPAAGVLWLDYRYMPEDAPEQVVGHTRQYKPTREGNVVCGNVIRKNEGSIGGEGVIVETPERIGVVVRKEDRSASCTFFSAQ